MPELPERLTDLIDELHERIREIQNARGILGVVAVGLTVLLAIMAIDLAFSPSERWMQVALSGAGLLVFLGFLWRWILRPNTRKLDAVDIARHLESVHPELDERLSSAIELTRRPDPGVSRAMVQSLLQEAMEDVEGIDPKAEITTRSLRPFRNAALLAAATMLLVLAVQPGKSFRLLGRALMPWMDIGNVWSGTMVIRPGNEVVVRGGPLDISMEMDVERRAAPVFLQREAPDGTRSRERLALRGSSAASHRFAVHMPAVEASFRYRVSCGRLLSGWYDIDVSDKPAIEELDIDISWPDYTGWGTERQTNHTLVAFAGSTANIHCTFNQKHVRAAVWYGETSRPEPASRLDALDAWWQFELTSDHHGPLQFDLENTHGFTGGVRRAIEIIEDLPPTVDLLLPVASNLRLRPDATLRLGIHAEDDVGIAAMEVVVQGAREDIRIPYEEAFAATTIPGEAAMLDYGALLRLGNLDLRQTRFLKVWVEVTDLSPEAKRARSRTLNIALDKEADSQFSQEIDRQTQQALAELQAAMDAIEKAMQAAKSGSPSETAERTRQAHAETKSLAESLANSALAPLSQSARQAAENHTEPASQRADLVPLTDNQAQEEALRRSVQQELAEAQAALEQMEQEVESMAEELQQLADLMELADREEAIAEAAGALQPRGEGQASEPFGSLQAQQQETTKDIEDHLRGDQNAAGESQGAGEASDGQSDGEKSDESTQESDLTKALQSAAEAATSTTAEGLQQGAAEAAEALREAADRLQNSLSEDGSVPGLPEPGKSEEMLRVPMPGDRDVGPPQDHPAEPEAGNGQQAQQEGQGQEQGEQPGEGDALQGGGADDQSLKVPSALAKLGVSQSDWARLRGTAGARLGRSRNAGVPPEYRELVERYFEAIAKEK